MSKSILVIDTPEVCCQCRFSGSDGDVCCLENKLISEQEYLDKKPGWCPLKEVPEKKPGVKYRGNGCFGINEAMRHNYNMGFNACIDEILKGANGNDEGTV